MDDPSCWQLQKDEILLLMSIYCGEGECLVSCVSNNGCSKTTTEMTEDALSAIKDEDLSETDFISIRIKLEAQINSSGDYNVEVEFCLPKRYPKYDPPNISITSGHMTEEQLIRLLENAELHSSTLLPEGCLYDTLQKIQDDVMSIQSFHPVPLSEEFRESRDDAPVISKTSVSLLEELHESHDDAPVTGKAQITPTASQNLLKCYVCWQLYFRSTWGDSIACKCIPLSSLCLLR